MSVCMLFFFVKVTMCAHWMAAHKNGRCHIKSNKIFIFLSNFQSITGGSWA